MLYRGRFTSGTYPLQAYTCIYSKLDGNRTRHRQGVVEHGPRSICARDVRIHTTPEPYSHFGIDETLNKSESTLATPALLSRITSHKTEHGSMHSSMARCSQSQPAAPTDEIDANGRTKRAASRVKGACAARTDQRRTTRRYPRPEHSRPRLRRPCGPPERGGVEASQNPGHRGRGSQAVRTARSRACVRQRAQSVQGTCKVRAAHTCKS